MRKIISETQGKRLEKLSFRLFAVGATLFIINGLLAIPVLGILARAFPEKILSWTLALVFSLAGLGFVLCIIASCIDHYLLEADVLPDDIVPLIKSGFSRFEAYEAIKETEKIFSDLHDRTI
jgi:hypothetical protein